MVNLSQSLQHIVCSVIHPAFAGFPKDRRTTEPRGNLITSVLSTKIAVSIKVTKMLTYNDNTVLTQLFDPEAAPSAGITISQFLPEDPIIQDSTLLYQIRTAEKAIIRKVESVLQRPLSEATKGLDEARADLERLLSRHPEAAFLLNDFAQIVRLQHGDNLLLSTSAVSDSSIASKTLSSLNSAISLLTPSRPQDPLSPAQARTLAQAHTQRGALLHAASKALATNSKLMVTVPELKLCTAVELAEAASRDFFLGGRYGNEVAKGLAVHTNPTAKLCGQMVKEALRREMGTEVQVLPGV